MTYQFCVKVPIALDGLRRTFAIEIPQSAGASYNPERSDSRYPHIQKAWSEVIANRADWAPSFAITA